MSVSIDPTDLFDEAAPVRQLVTAGRYRLPNLDGTHRKGGWQRVTNLVGAYSDTRALALWQLRMTLLGLRARHDLYEELSTMDVDGMDAATLKSELEYLADQAQTAAKADVGRRRGNARHAMVAHFHEGGEVIGTPSMRAQLANYNEVLDAHWLHPVTGLQERVIICEALGVAGRFDNVLHSGETGHKHIADLKTQRQFWTMLEVRAQLAIYANADAMWDEQRECYEEMPALDRELGFVMHMPQEPAPDGSERPVEILNIDLVKGLETAKQAFRVVRDRSEAKSADTLRSCVRPLPAPALAFAQKVEAYAARFASVATMEDGRALVAEIKDADMWCPELLGCAQRAAARIAGQTA